MNLSDEVKRLLLPSQPITPFVPDPYDVQICQLILPWAEVEKADVGLVGIPFDTSVMYRRGCRHGPKGVRSALVMSNSYEPGLGIDLAEDFAITDFGNIDVVHTDVSETHRRIEQVLTEIFGLDMVPLILGGDHGTTYASVKALCNNISGKVGVIMLDAHLDVRISHHGEISSGTPFRRILEEIPGKPVLPKNLVEVGINGWLSSKFATDYIKEKGIHMISAREVHKRGIEPVIEEAIGYATDGTEALFLSVDIDVLDFAFAPGTCAPNPGGLTSTQVLEAVYMIGRVKTLKGFDVVEVAPPLDTLDLTSYMGAAIAMQFMGAIKSRIQQE